jgi:hypothetical protein
MRLAFDLDGTVADMQRALAREARELYPDLDPATLPRSFNGTEPQNGTGSDAAQSTPAELSTDALSARQMKEVWRAARVRVNFWVTLEEI